MLVHDVGSSQPSSQPRFATTEVPHQEPTAGVVASTKRWIVAHKQQWPIKDMTMDKALFPTEDLSFRANVRVFLSHSCSTGAVVTRLGLLYLLHGHLEKLWFLQPSTK